MKLEFIRSAKNAKNFMTFDARIIKLKNILLQTFFQIPDEMHHAPRGGTTDHNKQSQWPISFTFLQILQF
jgi:hypothetical protein